MSGSCGIKKKKKDGGAALGYTGIPSVERSVAMQLCPTAASTLRGEPCLPSRACKYSSGLTGSPYRACGEAASALHAMALLQVHQAKARRDLHEGGQNLAVLLELRAATDLALRATKVTAQSLGRAMSMLVVQERHLWLCLTHMKEQEKVVPECSRVTDRPLRWRCRELCPAVFGSTVPCTLSWDSNPCCQVQLCLHIDAAHKAMALTEVTLCSGY